MWLFTKHGFITAVNARTGDGDRRNPADPDKVIIRTRVRSHMDNLVAAFPDLLGGYPVDEDTEGKRDYKYLMFVPKTAWAAVMAALADEMDYPKFKSAIAFPTAAAKDQREYEKDCLSVWNYMFHTQQ